MTTRRSRVLALTAVACLGAGTTLAIAPAQATAPAAMIRGGHFSPNTPGVDVYLTSFAGKTTTLWLTDVGYGDVSTYQRFKPGVYSVSMRLHGAAASSPAALSWTLDARAGAAYTACAVGLNAKLRGIVLDDDLATAASSARVRVIQAASRAPHATVGASGQPPLADNLAFATSTKYSTVRSGSYTLDARADGKSDVHASAHTSFAPDSVHTVVVLDAKSGGITLRVLDDAAGAVVAPVGGVPAGGGGTAHPTGDGSDVPLYGLVAVLVAFVVGAFTLRRRRGL